MFTYVPVDVMEQAVEQHYAHAVVLPDDLRAKVRAAVETAVAEHFELSDDMRAQFGRQLEKLDTRESYFLDLAAEEGWPKDKLREKINAIRDERKKISRQLETATSQLETGRHVFLTALDLLDDPHGMYQWGNETVRATLNRAIFTRLYVDGRRVTGQELNEPFDVLSEAYAIYRRCQSEYPGTLPHRQGAAVALTGTLAASTGQRGVLAYRDSAQTANSAYLPKETSAASRSNLTDSLALALAGRGSSKAVMVG